MNNVVMNIFKADAEIKRLTAEVTRLEEAHKTLSEENTALAAKAADKTVDALEFAQICADLGLARHNLKEMEAQHKAAMKAEKELADARVTKAQVDAQAGAKVTAAAEVRSTLAGLGIKPLDIKADGAEGAAPKPNPVSKLFGLEKVKASFKQQLAALNAKK